MNRVIDMSLLVLQLVMLSRPVGLIVLLVSSVGLLVARRKLEIATAVVATRHQAWFSIAIFALGAGFARIETETHGRHGSELPVYACYLVVAAQLAHALTIVVMKRGWMRVAVAACLLLELWLGACVFVAALLMLG